MTKKDYEAIAAIINARTVCFPNACNADSAARYEAFMDGSRDQLQQIVRGLCEVFMRDNPRFDADKFLKACGF